MAATPGGFRSTTPTSPPTICGRRRSARCTSHAAASGSGSRLPESPTRSRSTTRPSATRWSAPRWRSRPARTSQLELPGGVHRDEAGQRLVLEVELQARRIVRRVVVQREVAVAVVLVEERQRDRVLGGGRVLDALRGERVVQADEREVLAARAVVDVLDRDVDLLVVRGRVLPDRLAVDLQRVV